MYVSAPVAVYRARSAVGSPTSASLELQRAKFGSERSDP